MLTQSLVGLKVVDFTQITAGPTCTMMLADLGADVVKIEAPNGELGRAFFPFVGGESVPFMSLNQNKRSVCLNLKNAAHAEVARQLIAQADVVVESFRPDVMERLSLGYASMRALNPRLVYCSVTAYGQDGPWKDRPGVDGVVQAVSGLMSVTGDTGAAPCKVQVPVVDLVTGYMAAVAVLAAVQQRDREGHGQHVEVDMFSSALALQLSAFATYFADGVVPTRTGSAAPYAAPNEALRCKDGWIMVAAYHPERWAALCAVIGKPELVADARFADSRSRVAHRGELIQALEDAMGSRTKREWLQSFTAADIICGPINDYQEVVACGQFAHKRMGETVAHPTAGPLTLLRSPFTPPGASSTRSPAPLLGQHTREVLAELGYATDAIDALLGASEAPGVPV
ncbi:CaiB/BaiF CoA-transferase family protein [Hydrogenophaga sp.]|uniref:CaiB/BaiF CoA transferase family protein n=1 Tax=Hydrogenophaga sp. TaxID=1904254 RepID=UPI002720E701|nr:CoA transferase [Hydrogenophaga sp.]MDO9434183.1 CoA transferase [Hydrogenophaga sp.]